MPAKSNTQEFVTRAKLIHGDKFGYDKVEYKSAWEKVIIICSEHGDFLQSPANHLYGSGCLQCRIDKTGKANSMSQEEFIARSQQVHGERYDYSRVQYKGILKPVEIICNRHGSFFQVPNTHINNHGCPKCGRESSKRKGGSGKPYENTEIFINKAHKVHGNLYDYSLVDYKTARSKIKIICSRHGIFSQEPNSHLSGRGCQRCGLESSSEKQRIDTSIFVERARKKHGSVFDYSLVQYIDSKTPVQIICSNHGTFLQSPNHHLNGNGCRQCMPEKLSAWFSRDTNWFIESSKKKHENRYKYDLADYKNQYSKVKIICPVHGIFEQRAMNHLQGKGCPICKFSSGQRQVSIVLGKLGISFITEKSFDNCRDENKLPFDFYFEIGSVRFLIEYDGRQHFQPIKFWGGTEGLKRTQRRDSIKTAFALANNFHLIRIPYTQFDNIEAILKSEIQKYAKFP